MTSDISILRQISRFILPVLIVGAGIVGLQVLGRKEPQASPPTPDSGPPAVEVARVEEYSDELHLEVDGLVVPFREIQLAAEVAGVVELKGLRCEVGTFVRKDEQLIQLDSREYDLEVSRLQAQDRQTDADLEELKQEMENSQALLNIAQQDLVLQQREWKRLQTLASNRVVSASEADRAEQAVLAASNSVLTFKNQLHLLEKRRNRWISTKALVQAQLDKAKLDLERTAIRSPVDGVIVSESVQQGDYVQRGTPLVKIEDTSSVDVKCHLEMEDLYWIWNQQQAKGTTSAEGLGVRDYELVETPCDVVYQLAGRDDVSYVWQGELNRFDGIGLDEKTRTVPCLISVTQPSKMESVDTRSGKLVKQGLGPRALVRGMYVTVAIKTDPTLRIIQIPELALQPGNAVWRVRAGVAENISGLHVIRQISKIDREGKLQNYWLVEDGDGKFAPSDFVITTPLANISSGMLVKPISTTSASNTESDSR